MKKAAIFAPDRDSQHFSRVRHELVARSRFQGDANVVKTCHVKLDEQLQPNLEPLDIDEFDLRSNNSLNFWYDEVDNADGSCYDESTWLCVGRLNAAAGNVTIGFWTCAACRSTGFFDSMQPAKHQTEQGTWVFVPTGGGGTRSPPSSKVSQPRHRHRRRGRQGPPPSDPDDAGDDDGEGAESEIRTHDPTVDVTPAGPVNHQQRHEHPRQGDRRAGGQAGGHQQADQIEALTAAIQRLEAQLISGLVLCDHGEVYVGGVVPLRNRHLGPTTLLICARMKNLSKSERSKFGNCVRSIS